ncbi:MAG: hypothetical protein K5866_11180 [Treponema sp.]|nr:hypothetical protein [Treponema sp.]
MICWKCGKSFEEESVFRSSECPFCHADLHVCRACEFYENGAHNNCRESSADMVNDKERANFCDYFRVKNGTEMTDNNTKSAAAALFCLESSTTSGKSKSDQARDVFNSLFS